ncbi:MAG: hypothetical protein WD028_11210 [Balneolaceae bacterium]
MPRLPHIIKKNDSRETGIGRYNSPPKQTDPVMSKYLVTGFYQEDESVVPAVPDKKVQNSPRPG